MGRTHIQYSPWGVFPLVRQNETPQMSNKVRPKGSRMKAARPLVLQFGITLAIMLMLFGSLLLPATRIGSQDTPLSEEFASERQSTTYTPFVNDRFVFYWSPIDGTYEQEDEEDDYGWGMRNNNGQRNNDAMVGVNRYGDSPISDMGAIALSSYDWDNKVDIILRDGQIFTDAFMADYPYNVIDYGLILVYNGVDLTKTPTNEWPIDLDCDGNNDYDQTVTGRKYYQFDLNMNVPMNEVKILLPTEMSEVKSVAKMDRNNGDNVEYLKKAGPGQEGYEVVDAARGPGEMTIRAEPTWGAGTCVRISFYHTTFVCDEDDDFRTITGYPDVKPYSPHLKQVYDYELWSTGDNVLSPSGGLSRYDGEMLYTTRDLRLWGGTVETISTGRTMVLKTTVTEAWIDKNGNGIPDLEDDCDGNYVIGEGWVGGNGGGDDCEVAHGVDNAWFANELSADAVWSFYGDEFYGFVHRDMMIASYDEDNEIEIIDMSDGDDTMKITLDAWENFMWVSSFVQDTYCGNDDAGDNYELQSYGLLRYTDWSDPVAAQEAMNSPIIQRAIDSGNFESDWVLVKSKHPVTIYGGIWDNNWHMQIYGPRGSQYYIPYAYGITITGLDREAHVNIDFQDTTDKDTRVTIGPGEEWTFSSMDACPFSNNYVGEIEWAEITSDHPIRIELWKANDDNAFDNTQVTSFMEGFDYYPADETWQVAIHHRAMVYIVALEPETQVGWTGTWINDKPLEMTLDQYQVYRIVMDSDEDYDGDCNDDTEADNEDELEGDIHMIYISADKNVLVEVRYGRDYSCEPQDMDLAISINPTIQRASMEYPYFIPLLISTLMVTDLALVGTGRRGIAGVLGLVHRKYPMPKKLGK